VNGVQIGIRLPPEFAERLAAIARRDGTSVGKAARPLLMDGITSAEEAFLRQELAELRDEVSGEFGRLRKQMSALKEVIALCFTATMIDGLQHDGREVEDWVKANVFDGGAGDGND
jgi:predicted DNA-binding protein